MSIHVEVLCLSQILIFINGCDKVEYIFRYFILSSLKSNLFEHTYALWRPCSRQTNENNITICEIVHDEQYLFLPQCVQLISMILFSLTDIFYNFAIQLTKFTAADLLYVGASLFFKKDVYKFNVNVI